MSRKDRSPDLFRESRCEIPAEARNYSQEGADMEPTVLKIHYHNPALEKLTYIEGKGDWIDLRAAEDVVLKKGDYALISLGVSIRLPDGYEALIAPRSSTFQRFGILQANSLGVIDESYGKESSEDIWRFPALAWRDTEIHVNDRIAQFRILKHQPGIIFEETGEKTGEARGGFGSTGVN